MFLIYFAIFALGNLNIKDETMQKSITTGLFLLAALCAQANNYTVKSPDGKLQVNVECEGGKVSYTVDYEGKQMLTRSALGLVANYGDFSQNLTMGKLTDMGVEHVAYDESRIKKAHVEKDVVEAYIGFLNEKKDSMTLHLHVSNNDMAYHYELIRPKKDNPKSVIIYKEVSGFNFPQQTTTFLCPQITPMTGWERTKPSYEEEYTPDAPMNKKSQFGVGYTFPCLFKVGEDGWVLVSETGVSSAYPGSRLSDYDPEHGYTIAFPQKGENNGIGSEYAGIPLPGKTPWRTITIGKTLAPIVETTIPFDVVAPLYEPSINYKPARYTWSWLIWQDNSVNYDDQVKMIDVAAAQGYEAVLVDGCWDTQIGYGRIEELSKYAQSKGVKLMLWYNSNGFENDAPQTPRQVMNNSIARKSNMAWMKKIGVCGIKVDFFGGDKQETMRHYEEILSDADDNGLMVIFHGCTIPRGWERMYPNYVGSEAVLASENIYFTQGAADKEAKDAATHPFIRNTIGSMEFGGCFMNRHIHKGNVGGNTRRTTDVHELATCILFQNPIQNFAITPENLGDGQTDERIDYNAPGAPAPALCMDFLREVPTTWDETRFITGYPGRYVVLARRSGTTWYVCGTNATGETLKLSIPLSMWAKGDVLRMYADNLATREPELREVKYNGKSLTVSIPDQGGFVLVK